MARLAGTVRLPRSLSLVLGAALLASGCGDDTTQQLEAAHDLAVPRDLLEPHDLSVHDEAPYAPGDLGRAHDLATAQGSVSDGSAGDAGACAGRADGTPCDDGDACTRSDSCEAGVCVGGNPVVCAASDQCHVAGSCDPATGHCSNPAASDGTSCSDGSRCTQIDRCLGGVCVGTNPVVCSASDQCHVAGSCDPATGQCSNPAATDGTSCNDGNACTQTDGCQGGVCTGTSPVVCNAPPGECYGAAGTCDRTSGVCSYPLDPVTTPCSGGQCDNAGNCAAPPTVVSTSPGDATSVLATTPISITFSTAMDPTTLATQGTATSGGCDGTIQVSADNFSTCVTFATNSVTLSPDNKTATITPQPGLLVNLTFEIRVTTQVKSAGGLALASQFTQASGFTAGSPPGAVTVENETGSALEAQYCVVQFPASLTLPVGSNSGLVYGRIYEAGMTDIGSPPSASIHAQLGFGPLTDNPEYAASWSWIDAAYNRTYGNNAEYMASFTAPATAGSYGYVYRMSVDGGTTWTYCDLAGAGSNSGLPPFTFGSIAILTVTP
jgi:hypothetical protein